MTKGYLTCTFAFNISHAQYLCMSKFIVIWKITND